MPFGILNASHLQRIWCGKHYLKAAAIACRQHFVQTQLVFWVYDRVHDPGFAGTSRGVYMKQILPGAH